MQYDRGELRGEEVEATQTADYESKIAALERKVGQLTMEIDLLKKFVPERDPQSDRPGLSHRPRPLLTRSPLIRSCAFFILLN
ncbi:MAG: hypothetical protein ACRETE_00400 [Stenotrophobium sp.]